MSLSIYSVKYLIYQSLFFRAQQIYLVSKFSTASVPIISKGDLHPFIFRNIDYFFIVCLQLGITLNDLIILRSLFRYAIGSNPIANSVLILQCHKRLLNWGLDSTCCSNNIILCISIKSSFIGAVLNSINPLASFNPVGDISSIIH